MADQPSVAEVDRLLRDLLVRMLVAGAERWAHSDLTMPQLKVLLLLGERGSARVSWLASQMAVSPPNITGILDRLERRGWVQRSGDAQDRRVVRIVLTEDGHRLLDELCAAGLTQLRGAFSSLSAARVRDLHGGLSALLAALPSTDGVDADHAPDHATAARTNGHQHDQPASARA